MSGEEGAAPPPGVPLDQFFRHLWWFYQETQDDRARHGDVDLLAEAAERHTWPGAPEIGPAIAQLLRAAYCDHEGESPAERWIRDKDICALAEIHSAQGLSKRASAERIADMAGMSPDAVRKIIARKSASCRWDK
jgi:hypothetical protein